MSVRNVQRVFIPRGHAGRLHTRSPKSSLPFVKIAHIARFTVSTMNLRILQALDTLLQNLRFFFSIRILKFRITVALVWARHKGLL